MSDQQHESEAILGRLEPPSPPDALRDHVLHRAGAVLDRPVVRDPWARIYDSPPLRAAWAAAVLGLIVANVLLPKASRRSEEDWFMEEAAGRMPELRQVVAVPRLREAYVSVDAFAYRRPAVAVPAAAGPHRKEKTQ